MAIGFVGAAAVVAVVGSGCSRPAEPSKNLAGSASASSASRAPALVVSVAPKAPAGVCFEACVFVATADELGAAFRGWGRPLPLMSELVTRKQRNPFTKQEMTVRTRIPEERARAEPDAVTQPDLRRFELVQAYDLSSTDVARLGQALVGWDKDNAFSEVHGRAFGAPAEAEGVLLEVPPELRARLGALLPADAPAIAARWGELFREDVATIQSAGARQHLLETPDSVWVTQLAELAELARKAASSGRSMFLYMTP